MSDERKMRALFEVLADSVDGLSDEEVLAECREDGRFPEDVAKRTRAVLQHTVKAFKQRALTAAKEKHQESAAKIAAKRFRRDFGFPTVRQRVARCWMPSSRSISKQESC